MLRAGAVALWVLAWMPAAAQPFGEVYGRIADPSQGGVPQAAVTIINEDNGFRRVTASDLGGAYAAGSLLPGFYKITVRKAGFRTMVRFGVRVGPAEPTRADFVLPVGSIEESITVYGAEAPGPGGVSRDDAAPGARVSRDELERMPLNGRGLLTLLELAPATNVTPATRGEAGQFSATGQRANSNSFLIDGVSANTGLAAGGVPAQSPGGALPLVSAFGSLDALIPLNAIEEFQVFTSTATAEFGRLPGATVSLTSRSGSNEFHGATLYRIRNEATGANDWFANQAGYKRLPLRIQDVAQTFGGPLKRDRTFFFASYEHMALRQPNVWEQAVPALAARQDAADWLQPVLKLFPPPSGMVRGGVGEWTGRAVRPAGLDAGAFRLDQAISGRAWLFARYSDSPSNNEFGTLAINRLDLRSQSLTLGLNARPATGLALDSRINESVSRADSSWVQPDACAFRTLTAEFMRGAAVGCDYLVRFAIADVGQLVSGVEGERRQRQFEVVQTGVWSHGSHRVELGADYRRILAVRRDPTGSLGVIADNVGELADARNLWIAQSPAVRDSVEADDVSLWAQETWQATQRLSLTGGLRWEFSPAPVPPGGAYFLDYRTNTVFLDQHMPLWPDSHRNLAPRAALAYRLTGDGRTVLRAGGGLYYNSSLSIATDVLNGGPLDAAMQFTSEMHAPFSTQLTFGFLPDLRLPRVAEWNTSVERAFSASDMVSVGYAGASGRHLLLRELGGAGSSPTSMVALTTNNGFSNFHALEVQYHRRMARGLQALASYTWSHSIDNDSSDAFLVWGAPGPSDRAASDFDLRQSLTASASYQLPGVRGLRGWWLDAVGRARSGFPITVLDSEEYLGIGLTNAFRPELVPGKPVWVANGGAPGGRVLNPAAFRMLAPPEQGTLGRNAIDGFGMWQMDLALRREFRLHDRARVLVRIEAYNALNHPNFADPAKYLNSPIFGQSISMLNLMLGSGSPGSGLSPILQTGAARALQGLVRFRF